MFQTDPNVSGPKIGPDRPSVYTGPFWNRNRNRIGTKHIQKPFVLQVQFWIPSGSVSERSRTNTWMGFQTVTCKQKPILSGSVCNGTGLVPCKRSLRIERYNIMHIG